MDGLLLEAFWIVMVYPALGSLAPFAPVASYLLQSSYYTTISLWYDMIWYMILYVTNAFNLSIRTFWLLMPQVVIAVRNLILVQKATKGNKGQGHLLKVTFPIHQKPACGHQKLISPVNAQMSLSEKQKHILHENISNDIFRVWKRRSIHHILPKA